MLLKQGRHEASIEAYEEALDVAEIIGDHRQVVGVVLGLAQNFRRQGNLGAAKTQAHRALSLSHELVSKPLIGASLLEFAREEHEAGESATAARALGLAQALAVETIQTECDALAAILPPVPPVAASEIDDAILELLNEREFGALKL